jgi:hypothetical protein
MYLDGLFEMLELIKNFFSKKKKQEKLLKATLKGREQEKALANLNQEPWVTVVHFDINPDNPSQGSFELDWNEYFVKSLMAAGYTGRKDEEIVDAWFNDLCRGIVVSASEEMNFVANADILQKKGQ